MKVTALVGSSGTGKSYKAMNLARELNIKYLIDDGILIHGQKKLIGSSAKREKTKVAAVKRAIFMWDEHKEIMIDKLTSENPDELLIIGTSDKMVKIIAKNLRIEPIDKFVYIDEISTQEEIDTAQYHRNNFGKHVIPLPTVEVKEDFSGYFLDRLKVFSRVFGKRDKFIEKSVVRPTFSQMGNYTISNKTLNQIVSHSTLLNENVHECVRVKATKSIDGLTVEVDIIVIFGKNVHKVGFDVIKKVKESLELMTQMNIITVNLHVKSLHVQVNH